jgi:hypothetical protein
MNSELRIKAHGQTVAVEYVETIGNKIIINLEHPIVVSSILYTSDTISIDDVDGYYKGDNYVKLTEDDTTFMDMLISYHR